MKHFKMTDLFDRIYAGYPEQKCIYCDKTDRYRGWESLCNRVCYHGLCTILESYETGKVSIPDTRIVNYFTKHPNPQHGFAFTKLKGFITASV
jgi:hypothetical protein